MAVGTIPSTGKKDNKIYSTQYYYRDNTAGVLFFLNFITSEKIVTINDLINYIKSKGTNFATGSWQTRDVSGIYFSGNVKYYPHDMLYFDENASTAIFRNTIQMYSYSDNKEFTQFTIQQEIPQGHSGTMSISSVEV